MSIYITQQKKEEIEAKLAELQCEYSKNGGIVREIIGSAIIHFKKIISEAIVLPAQKNWDNFDIEEALFKYPNGVIICNQD